MLTQLPINSILPQLLDGLSHDTRMILQAAPGAGKSTRVPLACLDLEELRGRKILMLEPRRLAAQTLANYLAKTLKEPVGRTVGYRIRGDNRTSALTRLEIVTEGILTRMLQEDPELTAIGLVIFDEFHERSIHADLGLALCLQVQETLRPNLRILVMSATIDTTALSTLLGNARAIHCEGRSYPVEVRYAPLPKSERHLEPHLAAVVRETIAATDGDILVFLPGKAEINRLAERLEQSAQGDLMVTRLMSELPQSEQEKAFLPPPASQRKVIIATNIAETSITISGVRAVIDAGLQRSARFDPSRALTHLETTRISMASADQRKGRAGRESPGLCVRIWDQSTERGMMPFTAPEITTTDLTQFALELAAWGERDTSGLKLLNHPPGATLAAARALLTDLAALDSHGQITEHGRAIARIGVHPRLGHMLLMGQQLNLASAACDCAALLEERDILRGHDRDVSMYERWLQLDRARHGGDERAVRSGLLGRVAQQSARLQKLLTISTPSAPVSPSDIGVLIAFAYPDRIAMSRGKESRRYLMANGGGAELPNESLLNKERFIVIAELHGSSANATIRLAEGLASDDIETYFGTRILEQRETGWNSREKCVVSRERRYLGALTIEERPLTAHRDDVLPALFQGIRELGEDGLEWKDPSTSLIQRSEWYRSSGSAPANWPNLCPQHLVAHPEEWLANFIADCRSAEDLRKLDVYAALRARFTWEQLQSLDRAAPATLKLTSGYTAKLHYDPIAGPKLSVKLQEMYGQLDTPRIGNGTVPLLLELLSPAGRPLQVTRDLSSFWRNSYREVRKEMLGRYPKHYWPEDPAKAPPIKRRPPLEGKR